VFKDIYASVFPIKEIIVSESYLLIKRQGIHAFGITEDGKLFFNELPAPDNTFFKIPVYNLPSEIQISEDECGRFLYLLLKPRKKLPINVEEITSMA
jgi:hypothetical protein